MKHFFEKRLLPAVTLDNSESASKLAEAYLTSGLDVMEITFRTDATLKAIEAIANEFPEMKVGAGTILEPRQIVLARDAGARFGLAPGLNDEVVESARKEKFPFIPGVMTPSEIEKALGLDCTILKIFPARELGGPDYIASLEGPYAQTGVRFIPMGGVGLENLGKYMEYKCVIAAGGSWLAPKKLIQSERYDEIRQIVSKSLELAQ